MRILVLGGDGYIGWPLTQHLASCGHEVHAVDNGVRRRRVRAYGSSSLVPIQPFEDRVRLASNHGLPVTSTTADVESPGVIEDAVRRFAPDAVVHLAQQPSAPLSMLSVEHAIETQTRNVISTLRLLFALRDAGPEAHLVKLGTMGQYGTPEDLPLGEGHLVATVDGREVTIAMPKSPGSYYHASKVHDSTNIEMACRIWGLRATELNQGIVYGHDGGLAGDSGGTATRLDYDAVFGTVINRFCVQVATGLPISVYGHGGQTRGMIMLQDALECIRLVVESPPAEGEMRILNQMTQYLDVKGIANIVAAAGREIGLSPNMSRVANPRVESEKHVYRPEFGGLMAMGLKPNLFDADVAAGVIRLARRWRHRVNADVVLPEHTWR